MIDLFTKVHVPALALYFAVKVVLVAVSPVRTKDALACWVLSLANSKALVSTATEVLPPVRPNDMKHVAVVTLALRPPVTVTMHPACGRDGQCDRGADGELARST